MSIDRLFARSVCINLDRRPDRWRRMEGRFSHLGMRTVERVSAVDGRKVPVPEAWAGMEGAYGCLLSHMSVVAAAASHGVESLLVLEDDVEFAPDLAAGVVRAIGELPLDWSILYIAGSHRRPPLPVSDSLARATHTLSTLAYAIRHTAYDEILGFDPSFSMAIDTRLARLQARRACHCLRVNLAWPECDYSDIQDAITNHWYIKESLVIGDSCATDMEGRVALIIPRQVPAWRRAEPAAVAYIVDQIREGVPGLRVVLDDRESLPTGPEDFARSVWGEIGDGIDYLLVGGSPVYFSKSHLIGALEMCRRYPTVSPFSEIVRLTPGDTRRALSGKRKGLDLSSYPRDRCDGLDLGWGFFRRGSPDHGGWPGGAPVYQVPSFGLYLETREPRGAELVL